MFALTLMSATLSTPALITAMQWALLPLCAMALWWAMSGRRRLPKWLASLGTGASIFCLMMYYGGWNDLLNWLFDVH